MHQFFFFTPIIFLLFGISLPSFLPSMHLFLESDCQAHGPSQVHRERGSKRERKRMKSKSDKNVHIFCRHNKILNASKCIKYRYSIKRNVYNCKFVSLHNNHILLPINCCVLSIVFFFFLSLLLLLLCYHKIVILMYFALLAPNQQLLWKCNRSIICHAKKLH